MTSTAFPTHHPIDQGFPVVSEEFIVHPHVYRLQLPTGIYISSPSGVSKIPLPPPGQIIQFPTGWSSVHIHSFQTHSSQPNIINTTVEQSGPYPSAGSTSDAIDQELLREAALVNQFEAFVRRARNERFVDGMGSDFATNVVQSIISNGRVAVAAWDRILIRTGNLYETGEELLRQLGLMRHDPTHQSRLRVLIYNLTSADPRIREAAILGLSFLEDASALAPLRLALSTETDPWLRQDLDAVIHQLEPI